jgi:SAM-dependent methyltransferase
LRRITDNLRVVRARRRRAAALTKAAAYWSERTAEPGVRLHWGYLPVVRAHVAKRIAGREFDSISTALAERALARYPVEAPIRSAVSVGSGNGMKEVGLTRGGYVASWDCFEISEVRAETALRVARRHGVEEKVRIRVEDAFEADCPEYDLVFWSHSLHHMLDIDHALRWSLDHLAPGGLFLMDEFVGPNRFQWEDRTLEVAAQVRERLEERHLVVPENPRKHFPRRLERPSAAAVARADPTESVASEEILGRLAELMPSADVVQLGGVVYHVALSGIVTNFTDADEPLLRELLELDGALADAGHSVFAAATYRRPT